MGKSAIILGATGLTGGDLLKLLLEDEHYEEIILFNRNPIHIEHEKITEYVVDLLQLEHYKAKFHAQEVYCCIGTTKAKTSDKELYHKIDYGIPVSAAKLCKENDIETFVVISALGAKLKSRIFYNRTKGKMEEAVLSFGIKNIYILRPSLIEGEREETRLGEQIAKSVMGFLKPILQMGDLKRYQPIHAETIAKAMVWLANHPYDRTIVKSKHIQEIADKV